MKKLLFTLTALMMMGSAYADDVDIITFPDEYMNMELTEAQLGTEIQVRMVAQFSHYVNTYRLMFDLPEGVTITKALAGNGSKLEYYNADGDEETLKPDVNMSGNNMLAMIMTQCYDEDGELLGILHWAPGNYNDFVRVTFSVPADFAGGQINWAVEPAASGWGDHSQDCPKNSHYDLSATWTVPGGEQPLQDLTGTVQFGDITEAGMLPISYDGPENVTITVTVNGETVELVEGMVQLAEGENAVVVTVTCDGYNNLVAEGTFTYTAPVVPEVTATPTIQVTEGDEAYTITVVGDGELHLYANNVEVENPYVIPRGEADVTYYMTATAQEPGKEISEVAELTVVVPALVTPPADEPLSGDIEVGEVDPETGLLPVGYNGNEAGVTVTVTVNGEPVEVVDGLVQLAEGDNTVVVTVSGDGYETMTETFVVNWTKPVGPENPHMTGYWLAIMNINGELDWFELQQGSNGDYITSVDLYYEQYGTYNPNEDDTNRPYVPFYFVVNGVIYGAETNMQIAIDGDAMQNPLYAESENYYTVPVGFNYALGIAIPSDGNFYVYVSRAYPSGIDELVNGKQVAGVRYFNMAGQEMQEINGMTIVVTTYTDGTTSAVKVMK